MLSDEERAIDVDDWTVRVMAHVPKYVPLEPGQIFVLEGLMAPTPEDLRVQNLRDAVDTRDHIPAGN